MTQPFIPESQNKESGFYGTIAKAGFDAQRAWETAIVSLANFTHSNTKQIQNILDDERGELIAIETLNILKEYTIEIEKEVPMPNEKILKGYTAVIEIDAAVRLLIFRMAFKKKIHD